MNEKEGCSDGVDRKWERGGLGEMYISLPSPSIVLQLIFSALSLLEFTAYLER